MATVQLRFETVVKLLYVREVILWYNVCTVTCDVTCDGNVFMMRMILTIGIMLLMKQITLLRIWWPLERQCHFRTNVIRFLTSACTKWITPITWREFKAQPNSSEQAEWYYDTMRTLWCRWHVFIWSAHTGWSPADGVKSQFWGFSLLAFGWTSFFRGVLMQVRPRLITV